MKKLNITEEAIKSYVETKKAKEFNEFVNYCKDSIKKGAHKIVWELSNGDEIYFQNGFRKPHVVSPESFKGAKYGDYGYEGAVEWFMAFNALEQDGQFEDIEETSEIYGY